MLENDNNEAYGIRCAFCDRQTSVQEMVSNPLGHVSCLYRTCIRVSHAEFRCDKETAFVRFHHQIAYPMHSTTSILTSSHKQLFEDCRLIIRSTTLKLSRFFLENLTSNPPKGYTQTKWPTTWRTGLTTQLILSWKTEPSIKLKKDVLVEAQAVVEGVAGLVDRVVRYKSQRLCPDY